MDRSRYARRLYDYGRGNLDAGQRHEALKCLTLFQCAARNRTARDSATDRTGNQRACAGAGDPLLRLVATTRARRSLHSMAQVLFS